MVPTILVVSVKTGKRKNFHSDEPFHLNSPWNYRVFHTNGKRSLTRQKKQHFCTYITLFCTFLCRHCTTTRWKCLISRFVKDLKHAGNHKIFFLFMNLNMADRNSAPEDFACIWQSKQGGIITTETEKMWIHFSSDVFVAVSCRVNCLILTKAWSMQVWMPVVSSSLYFWQSVFSFRVDSILKWRIYINLKVSWLHAFL